MKFPVFDFHCDTALALLGEDLNQAGSLRKNTLHIDLERAETLGGYASVLPALPRLSLKNGTTFLRL